MKSILCIIAPLVGGTATPIPTESVTRGILVETSLGVMAADFNTPLTRVYQRDHLTEFAVHYSPERSGSAKMTPFESPPRGSPASISDLQMFVDRLSIMPSGSFPYYRMAWQTSDVPNDGTMGVLGLGSTSGIAEFKVIRVESRHERSSDGSSIRTGFKILVLGPSVLPPRRGDVVVPTVTASFGWEALATPKMSTIKAIRGPVVSVDFAPSVDDAIFVPNEDLKIITDAGLLPGFQMDAETGRVFIPCLGSASNDTVAPLNLAGNGWTVSIDIRGAHAGVQLPERKGDLCATLLVGVADSPKWRISPHLMPGSRIAYFYGGTRNKIVFRAAPPESNQPMFVFPKKQGNEMLTFESSEDDLEGFADKWTLTSLTPTRGHGESFTYTLLRVIPDPHYEKDRTMEMTCKYRLTNDDGTAHIDPTTFALIMPFRRFDPPGSGSVYIVRIHITATNATVTASPVLSATASGAAAGSSLAI